MIDLKGYKGFVLLKNDNSKEANAISIICTLQKIPIIRVSKGQKVPKDYVPSGSVEWCEAILGYHSTPDYYPSFLSEYLHRKVWRPDKWPFHERVFIKPADRYKRFTGFITTPGSYKGKKRGPYWCSEVVEFTNEWRYYISNGKVLCGEWYWGDEEKMPDAPNISYNPSWILTVSIGGRSLTKMEMLEKKGICFPDGYCGAVDFGLMKGPGASSAINFSLIEANHPFSCGWYGKNHELYCQWLVDGWVYMNKER